MPTFGLATPPLDEFLSFVLMLIGDLVPEIIHAQDTQETGYLKHLPPSGWETTNGAQSNIKHNGLRPHPNVL